MKEIFIHAYHFFLLFAILVNILLAYVASSKKRKDSIEEFSTAFWVWVSDTEINKIFGRCYDASIKALQKIFGVSNASRLKRVLLIATSICLIPLLLAYLPLVLPEKNVEIALNEKLISIEIIYAIIGVIIATFGLLFSIWVTVSLLTLARKFGTVFSYPLLLVIDLFIAVLSPILMTLIIAIISEYYVGSVGLIAIQSGDKVIYQVHSNWRYGGELNGTVEQANNINDFKYNIVPEASSTIKDLLMRTYVVQRSAIYKSLSHKLQKKFSNRKLKKTSIHSVLGDKGFKFHILEGSGFELYRSKPDAGRQGITMDSRYVGNLEHFYFYLNNPADDIYYDSNEVGLLNYFDSGIQNINLEHRRYYSLFRESIISLILIEDSSSKLDLYLLLNEVIKELKSSVASIMYMSMTGDYNIGVKRSIVNWIIVLCLIPAFLHIVIIIIAMFFKLSASLFKRPVEFSARKLIENPRKVVLISTVFSGLEAIKQIYY